MTAEEKSAMKAKREKARSFLDTNVYARARSLPAPDSKDGQSTVSFKFPGKSPLTADTVTVQKDWSQAPKCNCKGFKDSSNVLPSPVCAHVVRALQNTPYECQLIDMTFMPEDW